MKNMITEIFQDFNNENAFKNIYNFIFTPSKKILFWYRLGHYFYLKKHKFLSRFCEYRIYYKYHCCISVKSIIGKNIVMGHPIGIVIGEKVTVGNNCIIYQNVTLGKSLLSENNYPIIGDNVTLYSASQVLGNVKLSNGTVVGAKSLVLDNTVENGVYVGSPAKLIKINSI